LTRVLSLIEHFTIDVSKNIDTKQSNKRNNENSKKETQMTGQHGPL